MFRRVLALACPGPGTRILDVGVTPDVEIPYNNFFERWYPYPDRITACSIEDCTALEAHFPGVRTRRIRGDWLPCADDEFDLAVSFAVLEHVGPVARQRRFLAELTRVAREFVLYTPYRYFPVEMHTFLPLTHWLPARWHRPLWRRLGLTFWADEHNLNLLSRRALGSLLAPGQQATVRLLWSLGWPSNLEVHSRRRAEPGAPLR